MFSIFKNLKGEFDRSIDEAKLIEFNKSVRSVTEEKIIEYTTEIHLIMQRHFTNKDILKECKNTLKYIDEIIKIRHEINNIYDINNAVVTQHFPTKWKYNG